MTFFRQFLLNSERIKKQFGADIASSKDGWLRFFRDLDRNNNNSVSMIEFEAGLLSLKYPDEDVTGESNVRRKRLLALLDDDKSGELSFQEFGQVIGIPNADIAEAERRENERLAAERKKKDEEKERKRKLKEKKKKEREALKASLQEQNITNVPEDCREALRFLPPGARILSTSCEDDGGAVDEVLLVEELDLLEIPGGEIKVPPKIPKIELGDRFWVAEELCVFRKGPLLESAVGRRPAGRNAIVQNAGPLVQLPNGLIRWDTIGISRRGNICRIAFCRCWGCSGFF